MNRVAMLLGKPGEPGKVREFENGSNAQGKVRKIHKIDWLAIANGANFASMLEAECV